MRSKTFTLWTVWLTVALAGCSRCGKAPSGRAGGLAAHLPRTGQAVILVPDLGRLGDKLVQLQGMKLATFAAQLQGFPSAQAFGDALAAQTGVDLRSRDAMKAMGLAPERGLAWARLGPAGTMLVVGVSDPKKFESWFQAQARDRLGATQTTHPHPDLDETVFVTPAGAVRIALAFVDGDAVIVQGSVVQQLPALAKLQEGDSLAADPAFAAATAPLPADHDLLAWAPRGSPELDPQVAGSGAALSANLGKDALTARIFLPRPDAPNEERAFQKVDAPDLTWMLDADSVLRMRLAVDPARFAGIWQRYTPNRINFALSAAGVDVDHQVLGNAKAGAVAALSLAQSAQLGGGLPSFDVRQTNPFRYVQLIAATQVKDPRGAEQVVAQLAQNAPRFGAQMEAMPVENAKAWRTRYAQGEGAELALMGDTLLVAGPRQRFDAALARVRLGAKASPPALRDQDALMQPAVGFVLDLRQLADSVRALPSSAWGVGGFAIKATTLRWLDATSELSALTGGVSGEHGGLAVDLALRFAAK